MERFLQRSVIFDLVTLTLKFCIHGVPERLAISISLEPGKVMLLYSTVVLLVARVSHYLCLCLWSVPHSFLVKMMMHINVFID